MNEGHAAFLAGERIRQVMEQSASGSPRPGRWWRRATSSPPTRPSPPASTSSRRIWWTGISDRPTRSSGSPERQFLALGRQNPADGNEPFSMTVLAIRLSGATNGVSELHGEVSRRMWSGLWPDVPGERCADHVHHQRGPRARLALPRHGRSVRPLPWAAVGRPIRPTSRSGSGSSRSRTPSCGAPTSGGASAWWASPGGGCRTQLEQRGAPPAERELAEEVLDPEALTIGFARRFATYKRATLLFRDPDRLARILTDPRAAGADHLRRQGPPARPRGQGAHPADRPLRPQRRVPPADRLPGGLRHERGPLPGARAWTSG